MSETGQRGPVTGDRVSRWPTQQAEHTLCRAETAVLCLWVLRLELKRQRAEDRAARATGGDGEGRGEDNPLYGCRRVQASKGKGEGGLGAGLGVWKQNKTRQDNKHTNPYTTR